jgi:hypothetical protein
MQGYLIDVKEVPRKAGLTLRSLLATTRRRIGP